MTFQEDFTSPFPPAGNEPLTVSEVVFLLKKVIEDSVPQVTFRGEIFQFTRAQSGHVYLTLKDKESQLRAVIWRGVASQLGFKIAEGVLVDCVARPDIYHRSGTMQLVIQKMTEAGAGDLQRQFLELKAKLEKEGLFDSARKRSLPFLPKGIGIVTSESGAVIHDIVVRLNARAPFVPKYLAPVKVQGPGASEEIARAIRFLGRKPYIDVIIVGRGGGSLEDLWAFNEETTVRAIFASPVPVISAVGHESDVSLSDFVADVRGSTPTAAAELVVPERGVLQREVELLTERLNRFERWFAPFRQAADEISMRLQTQADAVLKRCAEKLLNEKRALSALRPERYLGLVRERYLTVLRRFRSSPQRSVSSMRDSLTSLNRRIERREPAQMLEGFKLNYQNEHARLHRAMKNRVRSLREQLESKVREFNASGPQSALKRGFAIVRGAEGRVLTDIDKIEKNQDVSVTLISGSFEAVVKEIRRGKV